MRGSVTFRYSPSLSFVFFSVPRVVAVPPRCLRRTGACIFSLRELTPNMFPGSVKSQGNNFFLVLFLFVFLLPLSSPAARANALVWGQPLDVPYRREHFVMVTVWYAGADALSFSDCRSMLFVAYGWAFLYFPSDIALRSQPRVLVATVLINFDANDVLR